MENIVTLREVFSEYEWDERLGAGASYYVPSNVPHGVIIHTDTVLVDVFTPQREDFLPT